MALPCDSHNASSASDKEEVSKGPSLQADGSTSATDDEGWQGCSSRSRCRRPKWTREEEMALVEAHCTLGNAWVAIAECLPGRTASEVKNIWHSTLRARKLQTRSVLRAYVTALKDRADKPAARQSALRAAQLFLAETHGTGGSPAKRVPSRTGGKRPPDQSLPKQPQRQLQKQQQQQLPRAGAAASPPPPPAARPAAAMAAGLSSEPGAAPRGSALRGGGAAGDAPVGGGTAAAIALTSTAAAAGAVPPAAGHRSSLGSDWSCVSSGAMETFPPPAATGGGGGGGSRRSGGGVLPAAALTPPPVMSFSPLVSAGGGGAAYAAAPAAAATAVRPNSIVVIPSAGNAAAAGGGSRFNSPSTQITEDGPIVNPRAAATSTRGSGGGSFSVGRCSFGGGGGHMHIDSPAVGADARPAVTCRVALRARPTLPSALPPPPASLSQQLPPPQQQQQHQSALLDARWQQQRGRRASESSAHPSAASDGGGASWDHAVLQLAAPPALSGYVISTGGCGGDFNSGNGLWVDICRRPPAGHLYGESAIGAATVVEPVAAAPYTGRTSASPHFPAPGCTATSAAGVAAQPRAAAAPSAAAAAPVAFSGLTLGGRGGGAAAASASSSVVTMGLYDIMDEDLLACLRA